MFLPCCFKTVKRTRVHLLINSKEILCIFAEKAGSNVVTPGDHLWNLHNCRNFNSFFPSLYLLLYGNNILDYPIVV